MKTNGHAILVTLNVSWLHLLLHLVRGLNLLFRMIEITHLILFFVKRFAKLNHEKLKS